MVFAKTLRIRPQRQPEFRVIAFSIGCCCNRTSSGSRAHISAWYTDPHPPRQERLSCPHFDSSSLFAPTPTTRAQRAAASHLQRSNAGSSAHPNH